MSLAPSGITAAERSEDLARRYAAAAEDAGRLLRAHPTHDLTARMRSVADAVWTHLSQVGVSWVGFYLPETDPPPETTPGLVLGPSRNKPACSPIGLHGVCGQAFLGRITRIVRDVRVLGDQYVACDPRDRSELVLPVRLEHDDRCIAVLDLDSHDPDRFGSADAAGLAAVLRAAGLDVCGEATSIS